MLYKNQTKAIEYLSTRKTAALYLDCGAGKTRILLETVALLRLNNPNLTCLIIAPIRVLYMVWPQEIKKWGYNFTYLNLHKGGYAENYDIYLVNPHKLQTKDHKLPETDILIIDESTYFKNHTSKRFKRLKKQIKNYTYRYLLSGTPAPRSYENLWPQYYLLDEGARLGKNISEFRSKYFFQDAYFYSYILRTGAKVEIEDKVKDVTYRLEVPYTQEPLHNDLTIHISKALRQKIKAFAKSGVIQIEETELITQSGAATRAKLRQLASGFIYGADSVGLEVHKQKVEVLSELLDSLQGQTLIVVYNYKKELETLQAAFKECTPLPSNMKRSQEILVKWDKGEIPLLAIQPQSAGHGLNLQHGGHHICWFSPTLDLELYLQANARLIRPGQTHQVHIHHLVTRDSIEQTIYNNLKAKKQSLDGLLKAMTDDIR